MAEERKRLSPSGYVINVSPLEDNPFWDNNSPDVNTEFPVPGFEGQVLALNKDVSSTQVVTKDDLEWVEQTGGGGGGGTVTVRVGSTATGLPGTNADVINSGTEQNVVLNFTIPRGEDGTNGNDGADGADGTNGVDGSDGKSATINVGTVQTVEYDEPATITNVGNETDAIFNFQIPKGKDGVDGTDGVDGATGPQGPIGETGPKGEDATFPTATANQILRADTSGEFVASDSLTQLETDVTNLAEVVQIGEQRTINLAGGTAGQVLSKLSNDNYSYQWVDIEGGELPELNNNQIWRVNNAGVLVASNTLTDLESTVSGIETSVDQAIAPLSGGSSGQVLTKTSGTNYDYTWQTPSGGGGGGGLNIVFNSTIEVRRTTITDTSTLQPIDANTIQAGDLVFFQDCGLRYSEGQITAFSGGYGIATGRNSVTIRMFNTDPIMHSGAYVDGKYVTLTLFNLIGNANSASYTINEISGADYVQTNITLTNDNYFQVKMIVMRQTT